MVKLYSSLLALTLSTSLALAAPLDYSDYLEVREPSFFGKIKDGAKDVGNEVKKGYQAAENIASNPLFQAAETFIPGGAAVAAAKKAAGKVKDLGGAKKAVEHTNEVHKAAPAHESEHHTVEHRPRRRDLDSEDVEELSLRDLDAEELFGREYDDFLVERDFFDDLD